MKQRFEIETKKGINVLELLGCLEDTLGTEQEISVTDITDERRTNE